jgi:atypical dual specificity phosphatase
LGRAGRVYRRVRSKFISKPTAFSWVIEGKLAASGLPSSRGQLRWIADHGVDSILTLTESPLPKEWFEGTDLTAKHVRMVDHAPPSQDALSESSAFIASQLAEGRSVLVHCLAGVGRTGSVIAAYMIEHEGKSAEEAIGLLREMRPGSVEGAQERAVREYERTVRPRKR